jgi:hypothetical protein
MTLTESLRHHLKVQFRLPPNRPDDDELQAIVAEVLLEEDTLGRPLLNEELREIVHRHVQFKGFYKYEGLDFQDLNALFAQVRAQAQAQLQAPKARR